MRLDGALTDSYVTSTYNGQAQTETQDTSYTFTWWDTAKVNYTNYYVYFSPGNYSSSGDADLYDWQGNMKSAYVGGGDAHHVNYTLNAQNEILTRDDTQGGNTINYVHEVHYYFDGIALGDISNNGTSNFDYAQSIANHRAIQGTGDFQNGATTGTAGADFDQSYDAINGMNYQPTASSYTVQAGDTLQSIADQLWGDSSFWYLIADANGLNSASTLVAGQVLSIPNKVHNIHNSTSTYRVYDPNKAQGNLQPIPPKNPSSDSGGGCGILGEIFLVIIAVVVSVVTAGAALAAIAPGITSIGAGIGSVLGLSGAVSVGLGDAVIAGAIGGAVGSIVSQGVGLALGIQNKFSWTGVAEAAIGGMVGAGIGHVAALSGGGLLGAVGRGLAGNVVTQGIEVATGLQKSFNWAETAAAGVAAGVGYEVGGALGINPTENADGSYIYNGPAPGSFEYAWRAGVSGMAGDIAGAATRSAISGTDFGDNLVAALPSVIGQTIGNMLIDAATQPQTQTVPMGDGTELDYTPSPTLPVPLTEGAIPHDAMMAEFSNNNSLFTEADFRPLDFWSPYIQRSNHYLDLQKQLEQMGYKDTYYFKAISDLTANLANMDNPLVGWAAGMSGDVRDYSNQLSQGIADFSDTQFAKIMDGEITETGADLDTRLITDEQNFIQSQLEQLSGRNPELYNSFIQAINANANLSGVFQFADNITDPEVAYAAQLTIQQLGRPINFANEQDRILTGQNMVTVERQAYQWELMHPVGTPPEYPYGPKI